MSSRLDIHLFGGLKITFNGAPITTFMSNKAPARLIYPACSGQQDALANWHDFRVRRRCAFEGFLNTQLAILSLASRSKGRTTGDNTEVPTQSSAELINLALQRGELDSRESLAQSRHWQTRKKPSSESGF